MSKHTPGPWTFDAGSDTWNPYVQRREQGGFVVKASDGIDRARADARLIAAAPELLIELQSAVIQLKAAGDAIEAGRYDEALLHARSMMRPKLEAIAKATREQP